MREWIGTCTLNSLLYLQPLCHWKSVWRMQWMRNGSFSAIFLGLNHYEYGFSVPHLFHIPNKGCEYSPTFIPRDSPCLDYQTDMLSKYSVSMGKSWGIKPSCCTRNPKLIQLYNSKPSNIEWHQWRPSYRGKFFAKYCKDLSWWYTDTATLPRKPRRSSLRHWKRW